MTRLKKSSSLLPGAQRGKLVKINVDGKPVEAYEGETVAAVLLSAGISTFRLSQKNKEPRSMYCGMGICFECLVTIDGQHALRACMTPVADGMTVETCKEMEL
ncbi:MAG: (2Fe-2S)-binding protein [Anaerolineaceae bacterium]|nr:(2Fe-2S)-binding protein [Anaerolineaceae bacterium]